jgi:hypothetical protein
MRDEDIEMSKTGLLSEETSYDEEDGKGGVQQQQQPPAKSFRNKIIDGACIMLNIASTVILVFLNNWYAGPHLHWMPLFAYIS